MIIATALQKGGVGKTTTVVNVAAVLAQKDKKVCIVDFDPQGNASLALGVNPDELAKTIYNVFTGEATIKDVLLHTRFGIDLIPANDELSQLDLLILQNSESFKNPAQVLGSILSEIKEKYDFILIDLPPSLSLLTINGLSAADQVLIPMQTEYLATSGVNRLLKTVKNVKESYNPKLEILGIVATMANSRTNLSSVVLQEARKHFTGTGIKVFETVINRSIKFGEAPMAGTPAVLYFRRDDNVQDYRKLVEEMFGL